jgi:hypothetical protein
MMRTANWYHSCLGKARRGEVAAVSLAPACRPSAHKHPRRPHPLRPAPSSHPQQDRPIIADADSILARDLFPPGAPPLEDTPPADAAGAGARAAAAAARVGAEAPSRGGGASRPSDESGDALNLSA